jgi:tetratricopeptide (TPR) repeat protein
MKLRISDAMQRYLRITMSAWFAAAVVLAVGGCAAPDRPSPFAKLNLPSPWATIKAAEQRESAKPVSDQSRSSPVDAQLSLDLLRGRGLERSGDFDKARKLYESLREQHPQNLEVVHRLGVVADAERCHAEAEGMFQFVLQRQPRNGDVLADLGYCYFLQGQLLKAESALLKAVAAEPECPRYRNNLGLVIGHQGRHEEALAHFREAGSEADAYYNLAFIYATQEQADQAKECFLMALNEDPTHGKSREALRSFEEYERLPEHLREDDMLAGGRVKYVPYIEGAQGDESRVQQVGFSASLPRSRDASQATRALHAHSRAMLGRNLQSQRGVE